MNICILHSDVQASQSLAGYLPNDHVDDVLLGKATLYRQLKALKKQNYDIVINLCRGQRDGELPAYAEVVAVLEELNLPHTGAGVMLYDMSKADMKNIAYFAGVETAGFVVAEATADVEQAMQELAFPLFVKPLAAGDGAGIKERSPVHTPDELFRRTAELIAEFDQVLIEDYIEGEDYSVLLVANVDDPVSPKVYAPINGEFYTACTDPQLALRLEQAAKAVFLEMNQGGYALVDFRVDPEGEIFFLEVNAPCALFGASEQLFLGDRILQADAAGPRGFLQRIIAEGIGRHQRRQKKYRIGKSAIATYGLFATQAFQAGEVIISGEANPQRIVTRAYVQSHWANADHAPLLRYVYPLGDDVLVLRGSNPGDWILENHSCDPNTAYRGLDLVALRPIAAGEEMTIDFAVLAGEAMEGFDCMCGASNCRGAFEFPRCCEDGKDKMFDLNRLKAELLCT